MAETKTWRLILRGSFMPAWSSCDQAEKNRVFSEWINIHEQWRDMGARFLGSLDDELGMCGIPRARQWNFYEFYEIPSLDLVKKMLDLMRTEEPDKLRLDKYFGYEAVMGYPIGSLERRLGQS